MEPPPKTKRHFVSPQPLQRGSALPRPLLPLIPPRPLAPFLPPAPDLPKPPTQT